MAYARLLDGSNGKKIVTDYTEGDPNVQFVPSIAAEFEEVPEGTVNGQELQGDGTFADPFAETGLSGKEAQALEAAGQAVPAGPGGNTIYDQDFNVLDSVPE